MGIKMFNINSPFNVTEDTLEFVYTNSGFLDNIAQRVPVYLVDRDLMDTVCPPQIRPRVKPERLQEMIRSFEEEYRTQLAPTSNGSRPYWGWRDNITVAAERLGQLVEQEVQGSSVVHFRAVYCQSLSPGVAEEIERRTKIRIPFTNYLGENRQSRMRSLNGVPTLGDLNNYQKVFGRLGQITSDPVITGFQSIIEEHRQMIPRSKSILICMERIVQVASRIKETSDHRSLSLNTLVGIIFSAYLIRELVHAYLNTDSYWYYTPWVQVLEKGLIAAYTMSCFKDEQSKAVVRSHLSRQPLEYKGFVCFEHFTRPELQDLLRVWSRSNMGNAMEPSRFRRSSPACPHMQDQSLPELRLLPNHSEEF
jgi:hypothetical protein